MTDVLTDPIAHPVDDSALAALFTDAHTINSFAPTPVSDEQLHEIWNLAKWAPTAANLQPLRVVFPQSPEARERLVRHLYEGNRAKTLTAPAVALLAVDNDFHELVPRVVPVKPELQGQLAANDELTLQRRPAGGLLHPGRPRPRPRRRPDGRLRSRRPGCRVLPRGRSILDPRGQHRPPGGRGLLVSATPPAGARRGAPLGVIDPARVAG
jgi:hypothetical protein